MKNETIKNWIDQYSGQLLRRAVYLLSDKTEAEDIVQEVFISAFSSYQSFNGKSEPLTWLMAILKRKVADFYRDFNKTLEDCLEELPVRWKFPMKMYYLEEKKASEVSQEFDISTTNLWKILQRSRMQLRECLEFNWFAQS